VAIDLSNRPAWLYEKNPAGKVPVLEEDTLVLPESLAIMEYLEDRYPEPALLPADPAQARARALARHRFDDGARRRTTTRSAAAERTRSPSVWRRSIRRRYGFAAIAYLPWIVRVRDMLGVELPPHARLVARRVSRAAGRARGARRGRCAVNVDELSARLDDPTLDVLDVRTEGEYDGTRGNACDRAAGAHPGRAQLDIASSALRDGRAGGASSSASRRGQRSRAYCHSGSRSALAVQILTAAGYDARTTPGRGTSGSRQAELPVET
jgi:glutathione S-transferase/rhodanese-related sulfurtransferase